MYRLISLLFLIFIVPEDQATDVAVYIQFVNETKSDLVSISKENRDGKNIFIFEYQNVTETFVSEKPADTILASSYKELKFKNSRELRKLEDEEIQKNIKKSDETGELKILMSINELFPSIFLIEKIGDNQFLKWDVYWLD